MQETKGDVRHFGLTGGFGQELHTIFTIICKLTRAKGGWISLLAPDGRFVPVVVCDLPESLARDDYFMLKTGSCRCQNLFLTDNLPKAVNILECERLERAEGAGSTPQIHATVPLRADGRAIGLMNLLLPEGRTFSEEDLELLTLVGRMTSAVLEQHRQYTLVQSGKEAAEFQLGVVLHEFPGLVMICRKSGHPIFINDVGRRWLGFGTEETAEYCLFDDVPRLKEMFAGESPDRTNRERVWKGEAVLRSREGHAVQVLLTAFFPTGAEGTSDDFVVVAHDISEQKQFEARLRQLADYDSLTGVYNRRRFQEELAKALSRAKFGSLLFIDFDNFKAINDNLGHRAGDELLTRLIHSLCEQIGSQGFVGRLGGDEFALFLPEADVEQAKLLAERISRAFRRHRVFLNGKRVIMTASIGIAEYPKYGSTVEQLLAHADTAMYTAKRTGAHVHVYDPYRMEERATTQELLWTTRIREALEKGRLVLYAQPILDLRLHTVSRYELLLRMKGDYGELISPKAFLGIAEKSDLIHHIDTWVAQQAIRLLSYVRQWRPDVCFHVNLSAKVFGNPFFMALLGEELEKVNIDPSQLLFEITETTSIEDYEHARSFISSLRGMGFHFALDDFGIGFSSMYSLKYLPLDYLKIDGVFIQDLVRNRVDQCLVKGLTLSMRELGIQTIAEFVEDEETMNVLRSYGVDYAQGFHVGRPRPIAEIIERPA
ncbi:MAG: EAL domain-containing protein [Alicyclobacillaceae bacterium]|nr:EAL domain-containing protein [Alicyclobacillaceae bacterium]